MNSPDAGQIITCTLRNTMDTIPALGRDILQQLPTLGTFSQLLQSKTSTTEKTAIEQATFTFGPHERHQLDVYTASAQSTSLPRPFLIFFYGGGFALGSRGAPDVPFYRNLGVFFASSCGLDVIIPDYRLICHGARYPNGGEDVGLALAWIAKEHPGRDVHVLGNSAGGAHLATWLFDKNFAAQRESLSTTLQLRKVVFLGVPLRFFPKQAMAEQLSQYYGSRQEIAAAEPTELMISSTHGQTREQIAKLPPILTLCSEYDPDIIGGVAGEFAALWQLRGGRGDFQVLGGHNHFSTVFALGTNDAVGEAWGHMIADWLKG